MTSAPIRPILLVEDSPNDVELTLAALARGRVANPVVVARDGVEALEYLLPGGAPGGATGGQPAEIPAVVLLDLKLPRVDGLEVLERIKRDPAIRNIPVVMLTSSREEEDLVLSYDLGVNAFVVKPVGYQEFFEVIRDLGVFWTAVNEAPLRPRPDERDAPDGAEGMGR
ncbi:response regulator [Roseomonas sp. NAR14]|uniref:Response regulator n=1 Tax=Roseomonas acroporae TaxID=2937791 RepID=A0A9X2BUD9_9PROT|nr:response regulator [Roseomonas acroporae]MCK8782954.1 response regulator [Roseomonas acroporae]